MIATTTAATAITRDAMTSAVSTWFQLKERIGVALVVVIIVLALLAKAPGSCG